ncbi:acyl dehydratase [Haloferax sp. MBLA0076]|uniref:Acyl dehydratase n=1 Tax=Haloferax litoreum TaxID=2666140 RepID=A0A6A8GHB8_9EURY|nr:MULTISPECIES: MaoC family dehydratase [Haloferax]KAB1194029.1 MaoC family dehydratase [Haloferax sp. CBA1148]MRX22578.1 acyl dehydratase [Haloferax litoreum]
MRFFEDLSVGDIYEYGDYTVTESEILEFAEQYDPQWFHTDPERAKAESMYGGVIASGWHTTAMTMRMNVDGFLGDAAALGAKGVDELRWWKPVYPGDTLRIDNEVVDKTVESEDRGLAEIKTTTYAERESGEVEEVCSFVGLVMFARRSGE